MTAPRVVVVGVGQAYGGDDAVGLVVAERLRARGIAAVEVADGAALADLLSSADRAIVIDAVVGAGAPGTVLHLTGDELCAAAGAARAGATPVSSHGLSIADAVGIARALGGAREVHLVGIAIAPPAGVKASLSEPVAAAVGSAAASAAALLDTAARRVTPA